MRLTNNLIIRGYLSNLNSSLNELNKLNDLMSSQRSFSKASDDPATALKAYKVRRSLSDISVYKNNIGDAKARFTEIESSISALNDIVTEASTKVLQGRNGTMSESQRGIIVSALREMQQQILNIANSKFSDKYIFGGSNVKSAPFTVDSSGALLYNGIDVDTGTFAADNLYLDIGLGISMDALGDVNSQSALDISYPGNELLGSGKDGNGISNNLYNILGSIADIFESNDLTNLEAYADKLSQKQEDIRVMYANIGERTKFIEFLDSRFSSDENNAKIKQSDLESVDMAQAILDFKSQENAYNAALMMGSRVITRSLIDYLN